VRDNRQCSAIDPSRLIDSMRMTTLDTPDKADAFRAGYVTGHSAGYDCGWGHGHDEGASLSGWKAKAQHYLFPALILGGMMTGWVACYFLQVVR